MSGGCCGGCEYDGARPIAREGPEDIGGGSDGGRELLQTRERASPPGVRGDGD
jgi:hypothetical protein